MSPILTSMAGLAHSLLPNQQEEKKNEPHHLVFWRWRPQKLLSIPANEVTFTRRGFRCSHRDTQQYLEQIGLVFLQGYHWAIATDKLTMLLAQLNAVNDELRGFAFEGAAMGLALMDALSPWRRQRIPTLLAAGGAAHIYMAYVGIGWAMARLPWGINRYLARLEQGTAVDPLLGWLAVDGYGFHQGYFHGLRYLANPSCASGLSGYGERVFDQGLGRSLWFVEGADIPAIVRRIASFPAERRADLWSGIGLAATYAGGVEPHVLWALKAAAHEYLPSLAQGSAFAAKARLRAGNLTLHTTAACQLFCGLSAEAAAAVTDQALIDLEAMDDQPCYGIWRQRIQSYFS